MVFSFWYRSHQLQSAQLSVDSSVKIEMAKGKVVSSQEEERKVQERGSKLTKVEEEERKVQPQVKRLTQVQEEGLRRAFARKAILSPRYLIQCCIDVNFDDHDWI